MELYHNEVVKVAIEDCDEALKLIYAKIDELVSKEISTFGDVCSHFVVLHCGVY